MDITYKLNEDELKSIIREHFLNEVKEEIFLHNICLERDTSTKDGEIYCVINVTNVKKNK